MTSRRRGSVPISSSLTTTTPMKKREFITPEGDRLLTAAPSRGMLPTSKFRALVSIVPLIIACITILPLSLALSVVRWFFFPSHKAIVELALGPSPLFRLGRSSSGVRFSASRTNYAVTMNRHMGFLHGVSEDYLAHYFLAPETKMMLWVGVLDRAVRRVPNYPLISYVQARTVFFDRFAVNARKRQVVILGAGFDTRAHRLFTRREMLEGAVRVFEVDIASTQAVKRARCEEVGTEAFVNRDLVDYVSVDFSRETFLEKLVAKGFDREVETAVLFEGVSYYLEWEALETTLTTIANAFRPGSLLALDFFYDVYNNNNNDAPVPSAVRYANRWQFLARFVKAAGEPFLSGFPPASHPNEVFEALGYDVVAHLGAHALTRRFLSHVAPGWENRVPYVPEFVNCAVLRVNAGREGERIITASR